MGDQAEDTKHDLKGRVLDLVSLVDYQDGSVVSREILRGKAGTMTVFAFDEGEGLSEHTAPFDATVFVLEGTAGVTVEGRRSELAAGQAVIMPAGKPHALDAPTRFKMLLVLIKE